MINKELNIQKLHDVFNKYNLTSNEKDELMQIIYPIFIHDEFQRRMTDEFMHHSNITLGEHIIEDAVVTYLLSKKKMKKKKYANLNISLAVKIAMMHDLYTIPWQNNKDAKTHNFFNKHGFRHPVEAVINAINWYPEIFDNQDDAKIIIDGIVHHMYPLPARIFIDTIDNKMELKNFSLVSNVSTENKDMLTDSLKRKNIGPVSISKSKYLEGKIMSKADKKVSRHQIKNISSASALLTGHNKSIGEKDAKKRNNY